MPLFRTLLLVFLMLPGVLFLLFSETSAATGLSGKLTKEVVITSDTMEADNTRGTVVFSGNVVVKEDFMLCSDELTIHYNDKREIGDIVALGSVRLLHTGKVATAAKATYDRAARTVILTGSPSVDRCGDTVSGEKITLNLDRETALVEGGEKGRVRALILPEKDCKEGQLIEKDFCRGAR